MKYQILGTLTLENDKELRTKISNIIFNKELSDTEKEKLIKELEPQLSFALNKEDNLRLPHK